MEVKTMVVENLGEKRSNPIKHCLPEEERETEKLHQSFLHVGSRFCSMTRLPTYLSALSTFPTPTAKLK